MRRFYFQQFVPFQTEEEPAGDREIDPSLDREGTLAMENEESMEGKEEMGILEMPLEIIGKRGSGLSRRRRRRERRPTSKAEKTR